MMIQYGLDNVHGILFKNKDRVPIDKYCMKSIVSYFRDQGYKVNWGKNSSNDRYWMGSKSKVGEGPPGSGFI